MEVTITTEIKKFLYSTDKDPVKTTALFVGQDYSPNATSNFDVEFVKNECITVNAANFATLSIDVFDYVKFLTSNVSFVQIHYLKNVHQPQPTPLRFQVSIGGSVIGKMSQLSLTNLESYNSDIIINDFEDPSTDVAYLFIVVGGIAL